MSSQILKPARRNELIDCGIHPSTPKYDLSELYDDEEKFGHLIEEDQQVKFILPSIVNHISIKDLSKIEPFDRSKVLYRRTKAKYTDFWTVFQSAYKPLEAFNNIIEEAKSMLDLEEGWDGDIAKPIDPVLFNASCKCISDYIEAVYNDKYFVLPSPTIEALGDGSIDFTWRLNNARMIINFRYEENKIMGYYYGDLLNNELFIKGSIPTDKVHEHLMKWMQNLK